MFIFHNGQTTGPYDRAKFDASVAARSIPIDALCGPTPQGPWSPVYPIPKQPSGASTALAGLAFAVFLFGAMGLMIWRSLAASGARRDDPNDPAFRPPASPVVVAPQAPSPAETIMAKTTLAEAIVAAKPYMTDTTNELDTGTALLGVWSTTRMKWSDVSQIQPETSVARVMKDSDLERGKRICASGSIAEIVAEKVNASRVYNGALMLGDGGVIRFAAVGDTGALVANSSARFCGIVTGRFTYSNAAGGTTHAVRLVGMFDLPENRKAK